jgi:hypothetical protein
VVEKNIRAVDKVQKTDPSNTAPYSKTFRDEVYSPVFSL